MSDEDQEAECVYCNMMHAPNDVVPAADDDAAWAEQARLHAPDCEWVLTRAHRRPLPTAE